MVNHSISSILFSAAVVSSLIFCGACKTSSEELESRYQAALTVGDAKVALGALDELLVRKPKDADLHANRGRALELLGAGDEALAAFTEACNAAPTRGDLAALRGAALLRAGQVEKATFDLRAALRSNPDYGFAAGFYAVALLKGKTAKGLIEAAGLTKTWLARDPDNVGMLVAAGMIAQQEGQVTKARAFAARARKIAPQETLVSELVALTGLPR